MQDAGYLLIPLTNSDDRALVDPEDAWVLKHRWARHPDGYARRHYPALYMHRGILGLHKGDGLQVDHINRNPLDNRRANLRIVVNAQNCQNRPAKSGYRGVHFVTKRGTWVAMPKLNYKRHYLGRFDDEIDAARAAEAFRREHMPFAVDDTTLDPVGSCSCRACRETRPARRAA